MKRIPLDVPIEFYEHLKEAADEVEEPVNYYIREAVLEKVARQNNTNLLNIYDENGENLLIDVKSLLAKSEIIKNHLGSSDQSVGDYINQAVNEAMKRDGFD